MTIPTSPAPPLIHLLTSDALPHAPETSNISWFNYLLNAPSIKTPSNATSYNPSANLLSQRSELLQGLSNKAAQALQKVSNSTNPLDMINSTRAMSAFHLETVLSARIISKTTQAIEKLTNLS